MRPKKLQQGVQSVEVGTRLLACLINSKRPMMLRDLAGAAGIAPAKAHRYLVSLMRTAFVEQSAETGLYDLGPQALSLGLSALGRLDPLSLAKPFLVQLHDRIRQTVAVAMWANHGATIVHWIGSDAPVSASLRVGSVMPLTRSATGRAFLAFLPGTLTEQLLHIELEENKKLGFRPGSVRALEPVIAEIRAAGFARTSDFIPGISGAAVPVFDHSDSLTMAIVTLGYAGSIDLSDGGQIVASLKDSARSIARRLGRPSSHA
jgi:DNA-binding IclR family transcriptional regulator